MEDHDAALAVWQEAGVRDRVLVHVDAHHDAARAGDPRFVTIANFVSHALARRLVRRVFWVVPDGSWEAAADRRALRREVAMLRGRPIEICTAAALPALDEPVLLDIDVDYLLIPSVARGGGGFVAERPWQWPEQLVAALGDRGLTSDIATVAYSVNGGYTPLRWKHLGDELAALLRGDEPCRSAWPSAAGAYYRACALAADGDVDGAQRAYATAVALDPAYRAARDSHGLLYQFRGGEDALPGLEPALRRLLVMDPADPYTLVGLGRIAMIRRRWADAASHFERAAAQPGPRVEAAAWLGEARRRQGDRTGAIRAFELSAASAHAGYRFMTAPIGGALRVDPGMVPVATAFVHRRLGDLYAAAGERPAALAAYRRSLAGGHLAFGSRARLALLYARAGEWRAGAAEGGRAAALLPRVARRQALRWLRRFRR